MNSHKNSAGFTLLELLMALAIFAIAGVSLAQAINMISLAVSESVESVEMREEMRGVLLEATRRPGIRAEVLVYESEKETLSYRVTYERISMQNNAGQTLPNLFEVTVDALDTTAGPRAGPLASVATLVYPPLFEK